MSIWGKIRRYFGSDNWQKVSKVRLFLVGNLGLFVIVWFLWMQPIVSSWNNAREMVGRQQRQYDYYKQKVLTNEDYLSLLLSDVHRRVMPYEYLASAMAEVRTLAQYYGLAIRNFDAAEPVGHDADVESGRFVELRVDAAFEGDDIAGFIQGLIETAALVRRIRLDLSEEGSHILRIEFSLFGV